MSLLAGKRCLVAGGAGEVGEGIVRVFLRHGATVLVPSRRARKLDELRQRLGAPGAERLIGLEGDLGTPDGAARIRDAALRGGRLDAVVASIGSWWSGPRLVELPLDAWHRVLDERLTTHFVCARTFVPVLAENPGSAYTLLNGGAAEAPIPGSGVVSIAGAAQLMLTRVLAAESLGTGVRINTLLVATPIRTRSHAEGEPGWLTADEVGEYAAWLSSDAAAELHGQTVRFKDRGQLPGRSGSTA
jgi:3-oxoacyl-[acyl-carrier protein] reductase